METTGGFLLLLVSVGAVLSPTCAVPADYMEGGMGESVHGAVRQDTKRVKQNMINPPQPLTQHAPQPDVAYKEVMETPPEVVVEEQTTYEALDTIKEGLPRNQLNDYPPEQEQKPVGQAGYKQKELPAGYKQNELPAGYPAGHVAPSAGYPFLYRGYPYIYGYPFDFRYGYAYGHAFGSDETFKCPSDGRFYRDFGSFYNCDAGNFKVQFCAPGSRNAAPARHVTPDRAGFCNVNMVGGNIPLLLPH